MLYCYKMIPLKNSLCVKCIVVLSQGSKRCFMWHTQNLHLVGIEVVIVFEDLHFSLSRETVYINLIYKWNAVLVNIEIQRNISGMFLSHSFPRESPNMWKLCVIQDWKLPCCKLGMQDSTQKELWSISFESKRIRFCLV